MVETRIPCAMCIEMRRMRVWRLARIENRYKHCLANMLNKMVFVSLLFSASIPHWGTALIFFIDFECCLLALKKTWPLSLSSQALPAAVACLSFMEIVHNDSERVQYPKILLFTASD